jgi:CxxC motif-containing protein (DUF1111 family)
MSFPKTFRTSVYCALWLSSMAFAQSNGTRTTGDAVDPGPRGGAPNAGAPLAGLSPIQLATFIEGKTRFQEVEAVSNGLGPRFNSNSCSSCHALPAMGGSSPNANPQIAFANSQNQLPTFVQANGPVREARFIKKPDGTPDGGVHALFVIAGRPDAPAGCNLTQEDYSNTANIAMRIPTPTFGLGLIEAIPDATLVQNLAANSGLKTQLGISGKLNRNGNDGTVTRFGWKAQNKSLTIFAAEAYNVEMGITNLLFPNERDDTAKCSPAASPQDGFNLTSPGPAALDDVSAFAAFMRFLAPPTSAPSAASTADPTVANGAFLFATVGCAACHTMTLQTGPSSLGAPLSNQTIHPFSDFAVHGMGPGLADQVSQGLAGGDEFRTAPLWGLGQRLFFLHDGRTDDLMEAIADHASRGNQQFPASEANAVIRNFSGLSDSGQQAILNFLRSL